MKTTAAVVLFLLAAALAQAPAPATMAVPTGIAAWPVAGTSFALSYEGAAKPSFNTVRIDPSSFAAYVKTGAFPAGTVLALEVRAARTEVAPAKGGETEGAVLSTSLHIKDERAGPGTWTFYTYRPGAARATAVPRTRSCYTCHAQEAQQDTAFTQFYPSLTEGHGRANQARPPKP